LAGLTVAQISEFSIILIALGVSVGHLSPDVLSLVTMVGLITIGGSTYMIVYSDKIYPRISRFLTVFENKGNENERKRIKKDYDAILFGYNRIGFGILRSFKKIKMKYLVVDFNPDTVSSLNKLGVPCLYGDAYDLEFLEEMHLDKAKIIVSTIPDFETNLLLLETIRKVNKDAIVILRSDKIEDAFYFYRKKANYVLTPHFLGGEYVAKMISSLKSEKHYDEEKSKHLEILKEMLERNKDHPSVERG
jgi:voltage-gated potassium channel Kch